MLRRFELHRSCSPPKTRTSLARSKDMQSSGAVATLSERRHQISWRKRSSGNASSRAYCDEVRVERTNDERRRRPSPAALARGLGYGSNRLDEPIANGGAELPIHDVANLANYLPHFDRVVALDDAKLKLRGAEPDH